MENEELKENMSVEEAAETKQEKPAENENFCRCPPLGMV